LGAPIKSNTWPRPSPAKRTFWEAFGEYAGTARRVQAGPGAVFNRRNCCVQYERFVAIFSRLNGQRTVAASASACSSNAWKRWISAARKILAHARQQCCSSLSDLIMRRRWPFSDRCHCMSIRWSPTTYRAVGALQRLRLIGRSWPTAEWRVWVFEMAERTCVRALSRGSSQSYSVIGIITARAFTSAGAVSL
jgi:hypothetical protein